MSTYKVQLQKSEEVAEGTMAFYFERPGGFDFKAGQFLELTLIDPPATDEKGNTRNFTIASAPYQDHLMITTRIRDSALKHTLRNSAPSTEVRIEGPGGSFTLLQPPYRRSRVPDGASAPRNGTAGLSSHRYRNRYGTCRSVVAGKGRTHQCEHARAIRR